LKFSIKQRVQLLPLTPTSSTPRMTRSGRSRPFQSPSFPPLRRRHLWALSSNSQNDRGGRTPFGPLDQPRLSWPCSVLYGFWTRPNGFCAKTAALLPFSLPHLGPFMLDDALPRENGTLNPRFCDFFEEHPSFFFFDRDIPALLAR